MPIELDPRARRILKNAPRNDSIDGSSWLISVYPIAGTYPFALHHASCRQRWIRPATATTQLSPRAIACRPPLPMFPEPIENLASQVGALPASGKASAEHTLP